MILDRDDVVLVQPKLDSDVVLLGPDPTISGTVQKSYWSLQVF